jgi:hypothetical protein
MAGRRGFVLSVQRQGVIRARGRSNTQRERLQGTPEAATDGYCSERSAPIGSALS